MGQRSWDWEDREREGPKSPIYSRVFPAGRRGSMRVRAKCGLIPFSFHARRVIGRRAHAPVHGCRGLGVQRRSTSTVTLDVRPARRHVLVQRLDATRR